MPNRQPAIKIAQGQVLMVRLGMTQQAQIFHVGKYPFAAIALTLITKLCLLFASGPSGPFVRHPLKHWQRLLVKPHPT